MRDIILRRYPWLSSQYPLTARELRLIPRDIPTLLRKLTDPWTTVGYAALIHGMCFLIAMMSYGHLFASMPDLLMPFLTPFGTPLAIGILHTILYWAMMIGLSNYATNLIAHDARTGSWTLLRAAGFSGSTIINAKLAAAGKGWYRVVRSLIIARTLALIVVPLAVYLQGQTGDHRTFNSFDFLSAIIFWTQPLIDSVLVLSLSTLAALIVPETMWARAAAYGLVAVVYGGLNFAAGIWLMFTSPLGVLAGALVPLGQWAPLFASVVKPLSANEHNLRIGAVAVFYALLPIAISIFALSYSYRRAQNTD